MSDAKEQKRLFKEWLENQRTGTEKLSERTVNTYISCMNVAYLKFTDLKNITSNHNPHGDEGYGKTYIGV